MYGTSLPIGEKLRLMSLRQMFLCLLFVKDAFCINRVLNSSFAENISFSYKCMLLAEINFKHAEDNYLGKESKLKVNRLVNMKYSTF